MERWKLSGIKKKAKCLQISIVSSLFESQKGKQIML